MLCLNKLLYQVLYCLFLEYVFVTVALKFCSILCDSCPFRIVKVCIKVTLITGACCCWLFRNCDWNQLIINGRIVCVTGAVCNTR